jgi:hypothetical protein
MRILRYVSCVMVLGLAIGGCGASSGAPVGAGSVPTDAIGNSKIAPTWMLIDSSSFRRYSADYLPEMEDVARDVVAPARGRILAASIDGSPLTTAKLLAVDFSKSPVAVDDPDLIARFNQARAHAFGRRFQQLVATRQTVHGSGLVEALALASSVPGDIYLWCDGVENVGGFDLSHTTERELRGEIRRWSGRLRGRLRGRIVTVVGAGRGVHDPATVERAHRLFDAVVRASDGALVAALLGGPVGGVGMHTTPTTVMTAGDDRRGGGQERAERMVRRQAERCKGSAGFGCPTPGPTAEVGVARGATDVTALFSLLVMAVRHGGVSALPAFVRRGARRCRPALPALPLSPANV